MIGEADPQHLQIPLISSTGSPRNAWRVVLASISNRAETWSQRWAPARMVLVEGRGGRVTLLVSISFLLMGCVPGCSSTAGTSFIPESDYAVLS